MRVGAARTAAAGVALGLLSLSAPAAYAQHGSPPSEPEEGLTDTAFEDSVSHYDPADFVTQFSPSDHIERLGETESEDEAVIVLETDILFAAMEWELPASANRRIAELVEVVPEGASVEVQGHTDSNPVPEGYDFDNQVLSENRAQAVADALAQERPDLELNVVGFGEDQPAVEEDPEDPATFAANRRVEIRYG